MPQVQFGEKLPKKPSHVLKLESKGDRLHFRLLDAPFIEGKHFFQDKSGEWSIHPCLRINEGGACPHCDTFFSIKHKIKKETDKTIVAQLNKEADHWKPSMFVYYPVINRDTQEFALFQTTVGVRQQIEDFYALGVKVLDVDFLVLRTESPGSNYYKVNTVDSAETKPLTQAELAVIEEYKRMDLSELVSGRYDSESGTAFESQSEVVEDTADVF